VANGDGSAARAYHERTKHSPVSVRSSRHTLDWENQPLPFKIYPGLEPIPLPRELPPITIAALDAIAALEAPVTGDRVPDLVTLTQVLYYSAGIVRRRSYPGGGEMFFRAAANTGALYHIDLYLVCGALPGLDAGVYHFGPHDRALRLLRAGDFRTTLVEATAEEPAVAAAAAVVVLASTYWRNTWKYQSRAWRHVFWDGGTLLANLLAVAAATSVPARIVAGFVDATVERLLDLDPEREGVVALVPLGRTATRPDPAPAMPPLGYDTVPLSRHEVRYPAIREAHAASSLATPEAVAAWRGRTPTAALPPPTGRLVPLAPLPTPPPDPLDRVILRRGSTREFARVPIGFPVLSTILERSTRGIRADWLEPPGALVGSVYLIVNAVESLPPGTWFYRGDRTALELLREGEARRDAGWLGLGQEIPADASIDAFVLADLEPILARWGDRGYRVAQLEGGILGGKMYLAAYALRHGASGLTFFDDDVTRFFSPHAERKSVMFLVALGQSVKRAHTKEGER
jgi:SagB-type dehydrogenase family enzyme